MTKNAENGGAAYLPAQGGFGYLAARIDGYGGKEPLSTAIYDTPEEAEGAARRMIKNQDKGAALFMAMLFALIAVGVALALISTFAADHAGFLGGIVVIAAFLSLIAYHALVLNRGEK